MLVPIHASTQLMSHATLNSAALDEAVTAFNAELSQTFQAAGQVIAVPAAGISNLVKLESTRATGPAAVVTVTVALAVLVAAGQPSVQELADGFNSSRFPATTFDIVTTEHMARLRGLSNFASAQTAAHEHAADLIIDIVGDTAT